MEEHIKRLIAVSLQQTISILDLQADLVQLRDRVKSLEAEVEDLNLTVDALVVHAVFGDKA